MKKYLILIFCLISTLGYGQEKPIKSYNLFGVKFSVDKIIILAYYKMHFNIKKNL